MGIVTEVGSGVTGFTVGDHAGVGCFVRACRSCRQCEKGIDQYCSKMVRCNAACCFFASKSCTVIENNVLGAENKCLQLVMRSMSDAQVMTRHKSTSALSASRHVGHTGNKGSLAFFSKKRLAMPFETAW